MLKNVFNPMLKYIQSQGKIYSIVGKNIFNPMINIFYLHGNKLTKTRGYQKWTKKSNLRYRRKMV